MFTNIKVKYKNEYYNVKACYNSENKQYSYLTLKIKPEEETDPKAIAKQNKIFALALKILNKKTKSKYEMYEAECEDGEVTFWIYQKKKAIKEDYFPY